MSAVKTFIDTNVLIYAFTADEPVKQEAALKCLDNCRPVLSTQVIKEFAHVLLKKTDLGPQGIQETIRAILEVVDLVDEEMALVFTALDLYARHAFSFYDSLIIAAALKAKCQALLSEDMQNGQVIDGKLTIINPFEPKKGAAT